MAPTCLPNINARERRKRLTNGGIILLVTLAILAALVVAGVNPWWRLALFPLFSAGFSGYFQWRDHT